MRRRAGAWARGGSGRGHWITQARGGVDRTHLVSNGLDLLPTLCDLTGVEAPNGLPGRSLGPLLAGKDSSGWRKHLMIETEFGWGVVDGWYKYTLYDAAGLEETLFDMRDDPGEMKNLAGKAEYEELIDKMRATLRKEATLNGINIKLPGAV